MNALLIIPMHTNPIQINVLKRGVETLPDHVKRNAGDESKANIVSVNTIMDADDSMTSSIPLLFI